MIRHFIAVLVATFGSILFTTIYLALDQQISVYPPHPLLIVAGAGFVFNLLIMKSRRLAFSTKERNWSMLLMGIFNITTLLSLFIFNRLTIEPLSIFILVISIVVIVVYLIAQFESLESKLMEGEELLGTFDTVRVV
ncbi:MAG: hypothetical protein MRY83_06000, partial [Flavobacteriales bacterium]|nr:hypothetical protein [Flavobacteriales bacterium]